MKKEILNNKSESDFDILKDIFIIFKLTSKYYIKLCEKFNIKQIEFQALYLLYISENKGVKMSSLGEKLEMARSGVTILVDRMALAGLVKRRPDVEDRRIMNVMITEKGNEIMNEIFPINEIFNVSILDFIKQDEKEILYKLIIKIKEKLESKVSMV